MTNTKYPQQLISYGFGFTVAPCWMAFISFMNSPGGSRQPRFSLSLSLSLTCSLPLPPVSFQGFFCMTVKRNWYQLPSRLSSSALLPPHSFHTLEQIRASPRYPYPHLTGLETDKKTHFFPLSRFQTITFLKSHFAAVYPPSRPDSAPLPPPPSPSPPLPQIKKEEEEKKSFLPPPVAKVAQSRQLIVT